MNGYITFEDNAGMLYILATGDPRHTLCLVSFLYDDAVRRMKEVRDIAQSLRLK